MVDANVQFEQIVREYWNFRLAQDPVRATELGVHLYDGVLSDRSQSKVGQYVKKEKRFLQKFKKINYKDLTDDNRIDRELALGNLYFRIKIEERHPSFRTSPTSYVEEITRGIYPLITRNFGPPEVRAQNLSKRLAATPVYLAKAKKNLKNPPKEFTQAAYLSVQGTLDFLKDAVPAFAKDVPPKARVKLNVALREASDALVDYRKFLKDDLLQRSKGRFALGKELFDILLRKVHHVHLSADDIRKLGEKELKVAKKNLAAVAKELDKTKSSSKKAKSKTPDWEALFKKYSRRVPKAERLLDVYKREVDRARKFVVTKKLFDLPAEENLQVVYTPEFARPTVPYATYLPPAPFESDQKGYFWVTSAPQSCSPAEWKQRMAFHATLQIPGVVVHETYPGRHLQTIKAGRVGRPLRYLMADSVFVEGWALYCEQLMLESNFFKDPASKLFIYRAELFRACRAIIDVGLHTGKMGFDEAVDFLASEAKLNPEDAEAEVRRYCTSPTEPLSYLIGKKMIMDLRKDYKAKKQRKFSLLDFHERVLACGPIPIGAIKKLMEL
ncbi:MAG: DUF885 domain-containing protein [Deltaproteobacteria bacterium]|nr:DUF885 domain-containing protein [Deltaproteobacteria bacterium]